jgi:hypothetical protein
MSGILFTRQSLQSIEGKHPKKIRPIVAFVSKTIDVLSHDTSSDVSSFGTKTIFVVAG